jgi:aminoglycoside phosphotransferase (APT) family kinase protein
LIPQDKIAAVARGLREAFGVSAFEDIQRATTGLNSDLDFRMVVQGSPYRLRIITGTDVMHDPTRRFTCMKAAAEASLAPHVWYTSIEDRISITDLVEPVPLTAKDALVRVPAMLRTLHALPPFPNAMNYHTVNNGLFRKFRDSRILSKDETEEGFARHAQVAAIYPRHDPDIVSSHNDLKPENIFFDGDRLWLDDWKAALLNDRYFDLAIVANFVVTNDAEERAYLSEYFGQSPDEYQMARFFLMRQVMHLLYAAMFLLLGSSGNAVNHSENGPGFKEVNERVWKGEFNLADNDMKIVYGRAHWDRLLQNTQQARFKDALRIVSDRHPCPEGTRSLLLI